MSSNWRVAWLGALGWVCAAIPTVAQSQDFQVWLNFADAKVDLSLNTGSRIFTNSDFDAIVRTQNAAAFANAQTVSFTDSLGRGAAYQDRVGINAVFLDTNSALADAIDFEGTAETRYIFHVQNTSTPITGPTTVPFKFVINSGEVRVSNFANLQPKAQTAPVFVSAEINIDDPINNPNLPFGRRTWRFTIGINTDGNGNPIMDVRSEGGNVDDFGLGVHPTLSLVINGDDASITIPRIEGTVDIPVEGFDSFPGVGFGYTMTAGMDIVNSQGISALAGITDPFALGNTDPSDDLGGPFDPLGVQFFLDGQSLSNFPIVVPEPSAAVMLGMTVLAVFTRRRK